MGGSGRRRRGQGSSSFHRGYSRETRSGSRSCSAYLHADSVPWHSSSLVRSVIMRYQPVIYSRLRVLLEGSSLSSRSSLPPLSPSSLVHSPISKNGARTEEEEEEERILWVKRRSIFAFVLLSPSFNPFPSSTLSPPPFSPIYSLVPSSSFFSNDLFFFLFFLSRERSRTVADRKSNEGIIVRLAFLVDE